MTDHGPDLNVTEARQGRRGRHVLIILIASLALVIIAFFAIYLSHADDLKGQGGQERAVDARSETFDAPEPAPKQNETAPVSQ